jgi:hypothetical protein
MKVRPLPPARELIPPSGSIVARVIDLTDAGRCSTALLDPVMSNLMPCSLALVCFWESAWFLS